MGIITPCEEYVVSKFIAPGLEHGLSLEHETDCG